MPIRTTLNKFAKVISIHFAEGMMYRARLLVWLVSDIVWMLVIPFIWAVVYGSTNAIGGYDRQMMISYFFFIPFIQSLVTYYHYWTIHVQIKEGTMANYLTRPIGYLTFTTLGETAYRWWQTLSVILLMFIVYRLTLE